MDENLVGTRLKTILSSYVKKDSKCHEERWAWTICPNNPFLVYVWIRNGMARSGDYRYFICQGCSRKYRAGTSDKAPSKINVSLDDVWLTNPSNFEGTIFIHYYR